MSSPDSDTAVEHVRFARAYAAERLPWFAPALYRGRIILTDRVGVAAVDTHYNIYWNPGVVTDIWNGHPRNDALAELAFLWIHEISHLLRSHADRAGAVNVAGRASERRWNMAADLEINDAKWPGLRMPTAYPGRHPDQFGLETGQLVEWYYGQLAADNALASFPLDEGSGVHGRPRPWEELGEQRITPLDRELVRRDVARRTHEADQAAIPESWRAWARSVLFTRVDWRRRLRHRLSIAVQKGRGARMDYAYGRPHRRQNVYQPVLPPSLSGGMRSRIAIVVDTSGSMADEDLQRALTEVAAIVRQLDVPVTIIPCDIRDYAAVRIVSEREAFRINYLPGGSGTDLRHGIAAAVRLRPAPDAVLVLTDGLTEYPTVRPGVPLLFGIIGGADDARMPPSPPFSTDQVVVI